MNIREGIRRAWAALRRATGDDAYERYLAHWRAHHSGEPLDRQSFHRAEIARRWEGVRRCC